MNHISNPNNIGNIKINKSSLADISELIRESALSTRVLFCIASNADSSNELITDVKTLSKIIGCKKEEIKYALRKLNRNGFIDIDTVQINHKEDIYKFIHDEDLYEKSKETIWNVVDTELVDEYKVTGTFNRITVNDAIIKCSDNKHNKVLLHVKGHLFFDKSINDNEIISEYWGD